MNNDLMVALDARDNRLKEQLDDIGRSIGYGRAIQLLGQLWDDMMQASYPQMGRYQEDVHRRPDIECIEAGEPLGRKVVYYQKRGRKGQITALAPFDFVIENVARIVSDTPLYGKNPATPAQAVDVARDAELVELLKAIRPSYGAVGSRDLDVTAQQKRIDRAIELLSRTNTTGDSKE